MTTIGGSNYVTVGQSSMATAQDPSALYVAALGALHLSPDVVGIMAPQVQAVFTAAYGAISSALGEAAGEITGALGSAVLSGALEVVGPSVVAEVGSVVGDIASGIGDAIPVVNLYVALVNLLEALPHATGSADTTVQDCMDFWNVAVGASMESDATTGDTVSTPADIFSSSPLVIPQNSPYPAEVWAHERALHRPDSTLGACLMSITESDGLPIVQGDIYCDNFVDQKFPHCAAAFDHWFPAAYNALQMASQPVGVPFAHQTIYRALRNAVRAHGPDHGVIPWVFWMDLFCADWDAGHLSEAYVAFLLGFKIDVGPSGWTGGVGGSRWVPSLTRCGSSLPSALAKQIGKMVASWKTTRAQFSPPPPPTPHSMQDSGSNFKSSPASSLLKFNVVLPPKTFAQAHPVATTGLVLGGAYTAFLYVPAFRNFVLRNAPTFLRKLL